MASSDLTDLLQAAMAPTEEIVTEEVIVTKEASLDNLVYKLVEFASYNYQLNTQAHLLHSTSKHFLPGCAQVPQEAVPAAH